MSIDPSRIPVLVGIGQSLERDAVVTAVDLAARAAEEAFKDAPGLRDRVQRLTMVGEVGVKLDEAIDGGVVARQLIPKLGRLAEPEVALALEGDARFD